MKIMGNPLTSYLKNLKPYEKWTVILLSMMFFGIALFRVDDFLYPGEDAGEYGQAGFWVIGLAFLIFLFIALPVSIFRYIKNWRKKSNTPV